MCARRCLARASLVVVLALLMGGLPLRTDAGSTTRAATVRYIVTLAHPPLRAEAGAAALQAADATRGQALAALSAVVGAAVQPIYVYRYALSGFALAMTPGEAAAVAGLPGVASVTREVLRTARTDRGPTLIGAAQTDLRPTLFAAPLTGAAGASGRAAALYAEEDSSLTLQLFYRELGGAPTAAELRVGAPGAPGDLLANLDSLAIGTPGAAGGYAGVVALNAAAESALYAGQLFVTLSGPAGTLRAELKASRGEGVVVGVLDTGVNVGHPAFQDPAPDGYDHRNPRGQGNYLGVCSQSDGRYDPSFVCNDKLIGAYTFDETAGTSDPQGLASPRDNDGHGSHVAATAVGNLLAGAPGGPLVGVAPHANLIVYDVCGVQGAPLTCSSLGIVAALDQAIADGVDVINLSLGGPSADPWSLPEATAILAALGTGIVTAAAAGNSGPLAGTIESPGNAPWALSVAASTHDRRFLKALTNLSGGNAGLRPGSLVGTGAAPALNTPTALIDAASLSPANRYCDPFTPAQAAQVAGKIVVCDDGGLFTSPTVAARVWAAGAAGAIYVGSSPRGRLTSAAFARPALQLGPTEGAALRAWLSGCDDCQATLGATARVLDQPGDRVAGFSSRGPDASVPVVLKPDLAGPGVAILAASADYDPGADDYELINGTSMATPHAAGLAALLSQIHPDWSPAAIKSALMLTAAPGLQRADGTAADPFDRGAGRLTAAAAFAGFVLDEDEAAFRAADPGAGGDPRTLNLASMSDAACLFSCRFTRTLRSTLEVTVTWTIGVSSGAGFTLTSDPAGAITLGPGEQRAVTFTATPNGASQTYSFGSVTFTPEPAVAPAAAMPVVIRATRTSLTEPIELVTRGVRGSVALTMQAEAISDLTTGAYGLVKLSAASYSVSEDPTPEDPTDVAAGGIVTRALNVPAGTTRLWVETRASTAPDLDLYLFADTNGDGFLEEICQSADQGAEERCDQLADDLVRGRATPLAVTIVVQNFRGGPGLEDRFELLYGVVGQSDAGNLTADGPQRVPAGQPFDLKLRWQLGAPRPGDTYIGVLTLGSAPGPSTATDLGAVPVTIIYRPFQTRLPLVGR